MTLERALWPLKKVMNFSNVKDQYTAGFCSYFMFTHAIVPLSTKGIPITIIRLYTQCILLCNLLLQYTPQVNLVMVALEMCNVNHALPVVHLVNANRLHAVRSNATILNSYVCGTHTSAKIIQLNEWGCRDGRHHAKNRP